MYEILVLVAVLFSSLLYVFLAVSFFWFPGLQPFVWRIKIFKLFEQHHTIESMKS